MIMMLNWYPKTTRRRRLAAKRPKRHAAIFVAGRVGSSPGLVHCAVGGLGEAGADKRDSRWRGLPAHKADFSNEQKAQDARS